MSCTWHGMLMGMWPSTKNMELGISRWGPLNLAGGCLRHSREEPEYSLVKLLTFQMWKLRHRAAKCWIPGQTSIKCPGWDKQHPVPAAHSVAISCCMPWREHLQHLLTDGDTEVDSFRNFLCWSGVGLRIFSHTLTACTSWESCSVSLRLGGLYTVGDTPHL
jgi:hypothetical protein